MNSLPFFIPENDDRLNLSILLITLQTIGCSVRGHPIMNNERLQIVFYLLKNPVMLNRVLVRLEMSPAELDASEQNSVSSIAINLDPLFDGARLKYLLKYAASLACIDVSYRKQHGFVYSLTEVGRRMTESLTRNYFENIRKYLRAMEGLSSFPNSAIMAAIKSEIVRTGHVQ